MKRYGDMTYDEQRLLLGLWRPTFKFRVEQMGRLFVATFGPIAKAFLPEGGNPGFQYDMELAYDEHRARGDRR